MPGNKCPKISIIIPIYNAERYLRNCIESVLSQSFKDFELLLINDGSTDSCGQICDKYATKDDRVSVFYTKNQGVSSARNFGLNKAKGEWIYFADSDDIVLEHAFENMMHHISNYVDYVIGGYKVYNEEEDCVYKVEKERNVLITKKEAIMEMFAPIDYRYQGYLWNKLFKLSVIRAFSLSFKPNIKFNEDRLFNVEYLCKITGKVYYSTIPIYKYYERSTSAMSSLLQRFNPHFITDLYAFVEMKKALNDISIEREIIKAHNTEMLYSFGRFVTMMQQFNLLDKKLLIESNMLLLKGIGRKQVIQFYCKKLHRKIHKILRHE